MCTATAPTIQLEMLGNQTKYETPATGCSDTSHPNTMAMSRRKSLVREAILKFSENFEATPQPQNEPRKVSGGTKSDRSEAEKIDQGLKSENLGTKTPTLTSPQDLSPTSDRMGAKPPKISENASVPPSPSQESAPKSDPQPEKGPETMKHQTLKIFNTKLTPEGGQKPKPTVKNQEKYSPPNQWGKPSKNNQPI